ncbi:MAG TPA: hypothetical protein VGO50_13640 [Pyrinomonadaceae bacterium]|jgi:hypothetical protein|nr:hypothetical protein [Pyrinomonadaceae bacterium]
MKASLLFAAVFFTAVFSANSQIIINESAHLNGTLKEPSKESFSAADPAVKPVKEAQTVKEKISPDVFAGSKEAPVPQASPYVRPTAKKRFISYVNGMFGPIAMGKNAATAGISTWRNSPEEWGDKWEGFGRRFASNIGKGIIKQTVSYSLEEAFKLDSKYYRSQKKDVGSRVSNALLSTVTARDKNGKRVFGFPRIAGIYAASITAAQMWYPSRFDWKDGVKNGTVSLGFTAAFNLVKEFIWKK